jgi:hypothetical protein
MDHRTNVQNLQNNEWRRGGIPENVFDEISSKIKKKQKTEVVAEKTNMLLRPMTAVQIFDS